MTSVVQPLIQPDLAAIAAHLQALFSPVLDDGQGGLIEIRHGPIDPTLKRAAINHNAWFRLDQIDAAAAYAADCNARGHNVYVGVNPRKPDTDQSGHGSRGVRSDEGQGILRARADQHDRGSAPRRREVLSGTAGGLS